MNNRLINIEDAKVFSAEQINNGNCTIGLDRTPSKWVSKEPDIIPVTDIYMTCGGGMGGASWHVYAKRIDLEQLENDSQFIIIYNYLGEKKILNKKYIVDATNKYSILYAQADIQNPNFEMGIYDCYYKVRSDVAEKVKLVDR